MSIKSSYQLSVPKMLGIFKHSKAHWITHKRSSSFSGNGLCEQKVILTCEIKVDFQISNDFSKEIEKEFKFVYPFLVKFPFNS